MIRLRATMKAPVFVVLRAPDHNSRRVRLHRVGAVWQTNYLFDQAGTWTVRASVASARVQGRSALVAPPPASTFTPPGASGCTPPSPANSFTDEARGAAKTGDLWALVFADVGPQAVLYGSVNKPTKIVWRLEGTGDATFTAIAPNGSTSSPTELKYHGDSIWNRPGVEWGSVLVFTQTGCWQIQVGRADNAGDLWLLVRS
jgi:hypothetical protein